MSILSAATADKRRGLVATLPELSELFHNAGFPSLVDQCVAYAQFVSDIPADVRLLHTEPEAEDEDEEERAFAVGLRQTPTPCARRYVEVETDSTDADFDEALNPVLDSIEDTECEDQAAAETEPEKVAPRKKASTGPSVSKKRKKPPSGVLPQRKSVRQWNRLPDGGGPSSGVDMEWALIGQARGEAMFS